MRFCDENNYKLAVSNFNCWYPSSPNSNSLLYWLRNGDLSDTNAAISIINEVRNKFSGHLGFHSYYLDDEYPLWHPDRWAGVEFAARKIRELDPARKSYISNGGAPPQGFFDAAPDLDIYQSDVYPLLHDRQPIYSDQQWEFDNRYLPHFNNLMNDIRGRRTEWQAIIQSMDERVPLNARRPNFYELRAMAYLALSRGARGITYYVYGSSLSFGNAYQVQGLVDYSSFTSTRLKWEDVHAPGQGEPSPFYDVTSLNLELAPLGSTIRKLRVYGAFPNAAIPSNIVGITAVSGDEIEVGTFKKIDTGTDSTEYFMLVNRVCNNQDGSVSSAQTVSVTFNNSEARGIFEVRSGNGWIVLAGGTFTDHFSPGEGRLYKVLSASSLPSLTIPSGSTLTVSSGVTAAFVTDASLTINGTISAVANSSQHISLTHAGSSNWNGITQQFNKFKPSILRPLLRKSSHCRLEFNFAFDFALHV
ncbi:MAG: hypothetical protein WBD36_10605 [Bacteroidota bacterium]